MHGVPLFDGDASSRPSTRKRRADEIREADGLATTLDRGSLLINLRRTIVHRGGMLAGRSRRGGSGRSLVAQRSTGATGLEPATSGVTGAVWKRAKQAKD